jgi:hypothetical protein
MSLLLSSRIEYSEPSTPEKAFKLVDDDVVAAADVELNLVFIFFIVLVRLEAVTKGCMLLLWRTMDCPAKASTFQLQARTKSKAAIKGESLDVIVIVVLLLWDRIDKVIG